MLHSMEQESSVERPRGRGLKAEAKVRRNRLGVWLSAGGRLQHWFASQVGVHPTLVSKWVCGDRLPNYTQALGIEEVTGGEVPASEWGYVERLSSR